MNASENTPPAAVAGIGASTTVQVSPPSLEWKIRDAAPPEAKYACRSMIVRQVPLAAKPNSPSTAGGIPVRLTTSQDFPRSVVRRIRNLPSTGSLIARPFLPPG